MLTDAIMAEATRLWRNRTAYFWGFAFVPIALLAFNLALDTYLRARIDSGIGVDLGLQILRMLEAASSPFIQVFFALGAGVIFAGDYRWETWRLIAPRNSRTNLVLAKFVVYCVACAASLAALALSGLVHTLYNSLLNNSALMLPGSDFSWQAWSVFLATWLDLMVLGAIVALFAVLTRATIGAAMSAIMFGFLQAAILTQISIVGASPAQLALFPRLSAETVGAYAAGRQIGPGQFVDPHSAWLAALFLVCWTLTVGALALVLFTRQDLSRE